MRAAVLFVLVTLLAGADPGGALPRKGKKAPSPGKLPLVQALSAELERSVGAFAKEDPPLYFLGYGVVETHSVGLEASYGAIFQESRNRRRLLDVDVRVGSPELDNTHPVRDWDQYRWRYDTRRAAALPLEDDVDAIRAVVWKATDDAFRAAQQRYIQVLTNRAVKVEETDPSPDFSPWKAETFRCDVEVPEVDVEQWQGVLRRVSAVFREHPEVLRSWVSFDASAQRRYVVNSEGSRIASGTTLLRVTLTANGKAEDGLGLRRYRSFEAPAPDGLPGEASLVAAAREMAAELLALREAPMVEPYTGPAILRGRAAAVFFHEVFGHRIEGHRQKSEEEGQTFARKVGERILPEFLTIYDDPTVAWQGDTYLAGHYAYDDEGVPAQRTPLVEDGVLTGFLMSRSPVRNFPKSNGHGRRSPGNDVVSRQGNLFIVSEKQVSHDRLREMMLEECRAQGKPYGLIIEDIAGGFTGTGRYTPQAFKVIPLLVRRIYTDGRADEIVRGVDMVGTPLAAMESLIASDDEPDVFNGNCGAESGWVPVSAVSPSLLVGKIEVEKKVKAQDRPPLLPDPVHDEGGAS